MSHSMRTRSSREREGNLLFHMVLVLLGAALLTVAFFAVLPFIQALSDRERPDVVLQSVDAVNAPPPPPPPEVEEDKPPEPEEKPPELKQDPTPLDFSQLELALNPGAGGGWGAGAGLSVSLNTLGTAAEEEETTFSFADLDQKPRAIFQPGPNLDAKLKKAGGGKVYVVFTVDESGKVTEATVQRSTDVLFERPALAAVQKWKFEPGTRGGKPVRFRMRVPITFPGSRETR